MLPKGYISLIDSAITSSIPIDYTYYQLPSYQIQFTEIGNALDENDMYNNGFIDIITALSSTYPV